MKTEAKYIEKIFKTQEEIQNQVKVVAEKINKDFAGEKILLITVMKGGINFSADLQKSIEVDCEVEYIRAKSYDSTGKIGDVKITSLYDINVENKNIILVEDFVDSGDTISSLVSLYKKQNPKSISVAATLAKPTRKIDFDIDEYYCFEEDPNGYLMGYGLDFTEQELFRNLPYLAIIKKEYFGKE